jgi:hypothetical protein
MKNFTLKMTKMLLVFLSVVVFSNVAQSQMPAAITVTPANATVFDSITLTFNPVLACFQSATLAGVPKVYMHSGLTIGGVDWSEVVGYNEKGHNGQDPWLMPNPDGSYSISYRPSAFYGVAAGTVVTRICAVFNDGQWDSKDGRDFDAAAPPACKDFFIPLTFESSTPKFSFKVNMNKMVNAGQFDPIMDNVYVVLDHGIAPLLLNPNPDITYTGMIETGLDSGVVYNFKYRINDANLETVDRSMKALPGVTTNDVWWNDDPINAVIFLVNMKYFILNGQFNPAADFMDIAGEMNGWGGSPHMTDNGDSTYQISYTLDASRIYQYKFRINGDWNTSEFPGHMYSNYDPTTVPVTFKCIMKYQMKAGHFNPLTPTFDYLDIAGNINGWGAYDVLFDDAGDSVYVIQKNVPRTYIGGSPAEFKFRFNGDWSTSEFPGGGPNRKYNVIDTVGGAQNLVEVWYDNKNPNVLTPPWAYDLAIAGELNIGQVLTASYTYENVNGIPEGTSLYKWYTSPNTAGDSLTVIEGATGITITTIASDAGNYLAFEVTPIAASGDSATGLPVKTYTSAKIGGVGIQEVGNTFVNFYPNPVNNVLNFEHLSSIQRVEIYSIVGQKVMTLNNLNTEKMSVNTSGLKSGIYFVRFYSTDNSHSTAKFIKN